MADENLREVFKALREAQNRYAYFLLAAAGAAIGFALNKTEDLGLEWSQVPLGIAVLAWALSFYFGCRQLSYVSSTLYSNIVLIQVQSGSFPGVGTDASLVLAASQGISQAIESNSARIKSLGFLQFKLLVSGALLFMAWHVVEMYRRSV